MSNTVASHGQFNNLLETDKRFLPTKRYLDKLHSLYDLDIFSLNMRQNTDINPDFQCQNQISANYYSPYSFNDLKKVSENSSFTIIHNNVGSLQLHLLNESSHNFDIIGISETKIHSSMQPTLDLNIPKYNFEQVPIPLLFGGVGMYISDKLKYSQLSREH